MTFGWGEVTGGKMTMGRNDRNSAFPYCLYWCPHPFNRGVIQVALTGFMFVFFFKFYIRLSQH